MSCTDSDPLEGVLQHKENSSIRVLQKNNHLEAVVEDRAPTEASFFLGDGRGDPDGLSLAAQSRPSSCQIQTPVEVHSPMETGCEVNCGVKEVCSGREESVTTSDTEEKTVAHPDTETVNQPERSEEANTENCFETERCGNSVSTLDLKDSEAESQEDVLRDVCSEKQASENRVLSEVNGLEHDGAAEGDAADVSCLEEVKNEGSPESETHLESEIQEETHDVHSVSQVESAGNDPVQQQDESDEDSRSLPSSNGSIVKVSDEESICDENEDSVHAHNGYMKTSPEDVALWSEAEASSRNILDLHMNGCSVEEDVSTQEDEKLRYLSEVSELSKSLDLHSMVTGGDLTENSDFSILESSCSPGLADSKCTEQETLSSLSVDTSEETHEVEAHQTAEWLLNSMKPHVVEPEQWIMGAATHLMTAQRQATHTNICSVSSQRERSGLSAPDRGFSTTAPDTVI